MSRSKHEDLQKKICFLCFKKSETPISPKSKELIIERVYSEFSQDEDYLPKSLCDKCRLTLSSLQTSKPRPLAQIPDCKKLVLNVQDNQRVKTLRGGKEKPCSCEICRLASLQFRPKISNLKCFDVPIESDYFTVLNAHEKGLHGPGRPFLTDAQKCGFCGKNNLVGHDCNVERIIQSISQFTSEVIATEIIKQKMIEKKSMDIELKCKKGKKLHVTCTNTRVLQGFTEFLQGGSTSPTKQTISHDTLMKLRSQLNLSGRKVILAGKIFKKDLGMKLEPYFEKLLLSKGHELDPFFSDEILEFESSEQVSVGKGKKIQKSTQKVMVYCLNVEELVMYIM